MTFISFCSFQSKQCGIYIATFLLNKNVLLFCTVRVLSVKFQIMDVHPHVSRKFLAVKKVDGVRRLNISTCMAGQSYRERFFPLLKHLCRN